jgi:hypothetical protein
MRLRIRIGLLGAAVLLTAGAGQAPASVTITGWSFDTAPYSVSTTSSIVASNLGSVLGNGYEIGFTNSVTNPGTSATYTYDSVNAAGQYVNLTATVDTTVHPLNSNPAVTGNTATNDIVSTSSSGNGSITENTWRVRSTDSANDGNQGFTRAAPQYTQGTQWVTSSTGYNNVTFSFDWFSTKQAVDALQVQYSTDGTTWTNVGSAFTAVPNTFFSGSQPNITVTLPVNANNQGYLGVRLVTAYDPSSGSPDYTGASGGVYNDNSGNWRLDNLTFSGQQAVAVPEPSSLLLCGMVGGIGLVFRRRFAKTPSGAPAIAAA